MEKERKIRMRKKFLLKMEVMRRIKRVKMTKKKKMNTKESMERKDILIKILKTTKKSLKMVSTTRTLSLSSFPSCSSNGMQLFRCNQT
jgi:hypothetical protein